LTVLIIYFLTFQIIVQHTRCSSFPKPNPESMTHGRYSIGGGLIFVIIISAVLKSLFSWSGKLALGLGRFLLTGTGLLRILSYDSWVTLIGIFHAPIKHNVKIKF